MNNLYSPGKTATFLFVLITMVPSLCHGQQTQSTSGIRLDNRVNELLTEKKKLTAGDEAILRNELKKLNNSASKQSYELQLKIVKEVLTKRDRFSLAFHMDLCSGMQRLPLFFLRSNMTSSEKKSLAIKHMDQLAVTFSEVERQMKSLPERKPVLMNNALSTSPNFKAEFALAEKENARIAQENERITSFLEKRESFLKAFETTMPRYCVFDKDYEANLDKLARKYGIPESMHLVIRKKASRFFKATNAR